MVRNGYNHHDEEANYVLTGYMYNDYSESFGKNLKANCLFTNHLMDYKIEEGLGKVFLPANRVPRPLPGPLSAWAAPAVLDP